MKTFPSADFPFRLSLFSSHFGARKKMTNNKRHYYVIFNEIMLFGQFTKPLFMLSLPSQLGV